MTRYCFSAMLPTMGPTCGHNRIRSLRRALNHAPDRRFFGHAGLVILCCLGLLMVPVECALAVGPHSLFQTPFSTSSDASEMGAMHHSGKHHMAGTETSSVATVINPEMVAAMGTLSLRDVACSFREQSSSDPVPQSNAFSAPADGTSPVSAADRNARPVHRVADVGSAEFNRIWRRADFLVPVAGTAIEPEIPPPEHR